jgi:hypothetical protein
LTLAGLRQWHGPFVAVARGRHERRDDVAPAIEEGDNLAALEMLVSAILKAVALFFQSVASFSRSSNLSVSRAGTGFLIGEGRPVKVQISGLSA